MADRALLARTCVPCHTFTLLSSDRNCACSESLVGLGGYAALRFEAEFAYLVSASFHSAEVRCSSRSWSEAGVPSPAYIDNNPAFEDNDLLHDTSV